MNRKKIWNVIKKNWGIVAGILLFVLVSWMVGSIFQWPWGDFWSNFFSNAGSSAVIGFVLYWIITRQDEKKATGQRRAQALSMLKIEFRTNLQRAKQYGEALQYPENDLSPYYPLRFTRGAWNALKESGFLPQIEDVGFVYELLRVNEIITIANSSFSTVRRSKADNKKAKLKRYAKKAANECAQIEAYLNPILAKLDNMKLPEVELPAIELENNNQEEDTPDEKDSN